MFRSGFFLEIGKGYFVTYNSQILAVIDVQRACLNLMRENALDIYKSFTLNPKIVIIGAGFGGIELAKRLKKKPFEVLIIDRNNFHTFQPLLYQVATGGLEPDSVAYPIRRIFRKASNIFFRNAEVERIDYISKKIVTSIGEISYDYLVIATGSTTNFFNFASVSDQFLTLKSLTNSLDIRSCLMQNLEKSHSAKSPEEFDRILDVAIVGGGPAGIELAGALAEMRAHVLPKDYPELDLSKMQVYLFESGSELLQAMSVEAQRASLRYLEQLGVIVKLNSRVTDFDGQYVTLGDGEKFPTETVVWTAGVKGATIEGIPAESVAAGNRIAVDAYNEVKGLKDVYAIGDVAVCVDTENPRGLPMLAPVAQQQGIHLAQNLLAKSKGTSPSPFKYKNKGVMATIGKNRAVVDLPKWKFQGMFAWFVWMFVHIVSLAGFRSKIVTFINWSINYFNYDRPLGLIVRKYRRQ